MNTFFMLTLIFWLFNGSGSQTIEYTDCMGCPVIDNSKWAAQCVNPCNDLADSSQSETCRYGGTERDDCDNSCNKFGSCYCNKKCKCICSTPTTAPPPTICTIEDINDFLWEISDCEITQLEEADLQIAEQIGFNIAKVLLGEIPVIGTFFDLAFAAYDPVSFINSAAALNNALVNDVNQAIEEMKACIDEKISAQNVQDVIAEQEAMVRQYYEVSLAVDETRTDAMSSLFHTWNLIIDTIFGTFEDNVLEYLGMLPAYQALYPLYSLLAMERILCLVEESDYDNLNYITTVVNNRFDILDAWILDARDNIYDEIETELSDRCDNSELMDDTISEWFETFDERYIDRFTEHSQQFNTLAVSLPTQNLGQSCNDDYNCAEGVCSYKYQYTIKPKYWYQSPSVKPGNKICCNNQSNKDEDQPCGCIGECAGSMSCCQVDCTYMYNSGNVGGCKKVCRYKKKVPFLTWNRSVCPQRMSTDYKGDVTN
eukprot:403140_1